MCVFFVPPTSAAASKATTLCLVSCLFPSRCNFYYIKKVHHGLVGVWRAFYCILFFLSLFAYSFVVLSVPAPPGGHDSDATTPRFLFCPFHQGYARCRDGSVLPAADGKMFGSARGTVLENVYFCLPRDGNGTERWEATWLTGRD